MSLFFVNAAELKRFRGLLPEIEGERRQPAWKVQVFSESSWNAMQQEAEAANDAKRFCLGHDIFH